jgi:hypothetical protein
MYLPLTFSEISPSEFAQCLLNLTVRSTYLYNFIYHFSEQHICNGKHCCCFIIIIIIIIIITIIFTIIIIITIRITIIIVIYFTTNRLYPVSLMGAGCSFVHLMSTSLIRNNCKFIYLKFCTRVSIVQLRPALKQRPLSYD